MTEIINPCPYKGEHESHCWSRGAYPYRCRGLNADDIRTRRSTQYVQTKV